MGKENVISKELIQNIADRHSLGKVSGFSELNGGTFNRVFKLTTEKGDYAVKIVAGTDKEVLTYERELIKTETKVYELLQNSCRCIPKIHGYNYGDDYSCKYLIMDFVEGKMLNKSKLSAV